MGEVWVVYFPNCNSEVVIDYWSLISWLPQLNELAGGGNNAQKLKVPKP